VDDLYALLESQLGLKRPSTAAPAPAVNR